MVLNDYFLGPQTIGDVKCLICDIDGTIADGSHRYHFVKTKPKNWSAFESLAHKDKPIQHVIDVVSQIHRNGSKVVICSGRGSHQKLQTEEWLAIHNVPHDVIYMRNSGDYRQDSIVKKELLKQMRYDGFNPDLVFDDRQQVVDMWREEGLRVIQVAEGNF